MSTLETIGPRSGAAPQTYTVNELGTVEPQSVFARFNGAAASGSWVPALTIRSQNGTILSRTSPDTTLAIGDTTDVTFAPFLRGGAAAASGGVQFDTDPQAAAFLSFQLSGSFTPSVGGAVYLAVTGKTTIDTGTELVVYAGTDVTMSAGTFITLEAQTGFHLRPGNGDAETFLLAGNSVYVYDHFGSTILEVRESGLIRMPTLPILDPGVSGGLWNNGGVVNVSP